MKKLCLRISETIKKITIYDIMFFVAALAVFVYAVLATPAHSIADQGDFERVMRPCGLDFPEGEYSFYGFAQRFFVRKFTIWDRMLYIPRLLFIVPTTTFIFPTMIAKVICFPLGAFDMRVLAVVMFTWYTVVCMLILRRMQIKNTVLKCVFTAFFILMFYNGISITFFNSLYGQSVMLASFATVVLAGLMLFDGRNKVTKRTLVFFAIASCLLLGSKLQCVVFVPFMVVALFVAAKKNGLKKAGIFCIVLVVWHGVGGYIINGGQLNMDTQYNSVFYGILKDSPDPVADLRFLGIDEDMAQDAGKHAYLDESEYKYPPRTEIAKEKFHSKMSNSKLIKFYIMHPLRLMDAMQTTSESAFYNRIFLGTFEQKYGFEEGKSEYRFDLWDDVRASFRGSIVFVIAVWCVFLTMGAVMIKKKNPLGLPFVAVLLMGALQFPMPYMGNGAADISKQLFLFNTVFDMGLAVFAYMLISEIDSRLGKRTGV